MKYRSTVGFYLLLFLALISDIAMAGGSGSSYLSPMEQEVLDELNLARTFPAQYAELLAEMRPFFNGTRLERPGEVILVTQEGISAVDEAIYFLRSTKPLSPLRGSRGLALAAKAHVKDQQDGALGHEGSDGSQPWGRMSRYGTWSGKVAENISYGAGTARGVVILGIGSTCSILNIDLWEWAAVLMPDSGIRVPWIMRRGIQTG
jgi:uncharacterized protein YkwD